MTQADIFAVGSVLKMPDGSEIALREATQLEQSEFQRWLEQRAHDAIDRSSASEEQKDRRHAIVDKDAALGKYEWEGPYGVEARWTPAGLTKAVEIVCRDQGVRHARAVEIVRHHFRECAAKILMQAAENPKALAPVLGALGYPMDWFASAPSEPSSSASSTLPSTEASPNSETAPTPNSCSSSPASDTPTDP